MAIRVIDKKTKRNLIIMLVVQIIMLFVFYDIIRDNRAVQPQDVKYTEITVNDTVYYNSSYKGRHSRRFIICSDNENYYFADVEEYADYSDKRLSEIISIGDTIQIGYIKGGGLFNTKNLIVEAQIQNTKYRTLEQYNNSSEHGGIFSAGVILFAESVWIITLVFTLWTDGVFKRFSNKKKKGEVKKRRK